MKNTALWTALLVAAGVGLWAYKSGRIQIGSNGKVYLTTAKIPLTPEGVPIANPNWPRDPKTNEPLRPGTIIDPNQQYQHGAIVNQYGYLV